MSYAPGPVPKDPRDLPGFLANELPQIADIGRQPSFIAPALQNSWVNYGSGFAPAGFYRDPLGRVHFRGLIKNGTTTGTVHLFTLPADCVPSENLIIPVATINGSTLSLAILQIEASTHKVHVSFAQATWLSLSGVSFAAI